MLLTDTWSVCRGTINWNADASTDLGLGAICPLAGFSNGVWVALISRIIDTILADRTVDIVDAAAFILDTAVFPAGFPICAFIVRLALQLAFTTGVIAVNRYLDAPLANKAALICPRAVLSAQLVAAIFTIFKPVTLKCGINTFAIGTFKLVATALYRLTAHLIATIVAIVVPIAPAVPGNALSTLTAEFVVPTFRCWAVRFITLIFAIRNAITD